MNRTRPLVAVGAVLAGAVFLHATTLPAQNSAGVAVVAHNSAADQYSVWRTFKLYCISCHVGPRAPAGLNLQALDEGNLEKNGATWEKLLRKLRTREMPPAGLPRPNEAGYEALVRYIEGERDRLVDAKPNPGRLTIHRLNRTEYANTIRDLLALEVDVSELLPADDIG